MALVVDAALPADEDHAVGEAARRGIHRGHAEEHVRAVFPRLGVQSIDERTHAVIKTG